MRRLMLNSETEDEEVKEWEVLAEVVTESEQTEMFTFEFGKGYKEIAVFMTYPVNEGNTQDKTLVIDLNDVKRSFGAMSYLLFKYAQQIELRIETSPFIKCEFLKSDINPNWFGNGCNVTAKIRNVIGIEEVKKIAIGSENSDFIFGSGTTITIKGR